MIISFACPDTESLARGEREIRRQEIITIADAEREAAEIRAGRVKLSESRYALTLAAPQNAVTRVEPTLNDRPVVEVVTAGIVSDALRREANVARAIVHAESRLKDDQQPPPEESVDSDWLFRWRDYAGAVSKDELQTLWGSLLAGEVKSPGSYSLRTLDFIRNLSVQDAKNIELLSRFVITDFVARDQQAILDKEGMTLINILELQNIGVISGAESIGLAIALNSIDRNRFIRLLISHGRAIIVRHDDPDKVLNLKAYPITSPGREVMRLGDFQVSEPYLSAVAESIKSAGFSVSVADFRISDADHVADFRISDADHIEIDNEREI